MKYFEFNKHEYWAMVAAESEKKAYEIYQDEVGGNSIAEVMTEGKVEELEKHVAFGMYINAAIKYSDKHYFEASCEFHSSNNTTLLIDSSLA